ncbi:heterokaryon incompatibility protein-domain-containing protein [Apiosordaria backusii]|uniref:Heterokaryon incompatibility protein-domain-containing protein n=1 Tax=Apiosordaria backusii TaxID=314023 RepID=A0AA40K0U1_9PEZI|nr:heterokaryon incompatibility protein-domain-containing protein [Apiosordaria backusii]
MASLPLYQYKPLDLSADSVRLVRLCKGAYDEQIHCELLETYIRDSEGIPYEALSYTWGGTDRQGFIVVDHTSIVQVTGNLYTALVNLRHQHSDRLLWIDAICIDQNNDRERGHQVGQMRKIYENAEEVMVWLGPGGTFEANLAIKFLGEVNEQVLATNQMWSWRSRKESWKSELNYRRTMFLERLPDDTLAKYRYAFDSLLASPWFRRVWIIQEIACSRKASIMCGRKSIPSRTFAIAPEFLALQVDGQVQAVLDVMPGFRRSESWWSHKRTLGMLLQKFRDSEASDFRDKVFALLGMAPDAEAAITPDYEKDPRHLVQQTASFLVFGVVVEKEVYEFPPWSLSSLPDRTEEMVEEALHRLMSGRPLSADVRIPIPVRVNANDLLTDWGGQGLDFQGYIMGLAQGHDERDLMKLASFVLRNAGEAVTAMARTQNLALTGYQPLGLLAVYLAAKYQQWKVVKLLIGYPTAILNSVADNLQRPGLPRAIWMATWNRHLRMIRLIKYGVDIPAKWKHGPLRTEDTLDLFNSLVAFEGAPDIILSEFIDSESMMRGWWHVHAREVKMLDLLASYGAPLDRIWASPSREHWVSNAHKIVEALTENGVEIGPVCTALCKASDLERQGG